MGTTCLHDEIEQWTDYQTFGAHIRCTKCGAHVVLPPAVIRRVIEGERIGTYSALLDAPKSESDPAHTSA